MRKTTMMMTMRIMLNSVTMMNPLKRFVSMAVSFLFSLWFPQQSFSELCVELFSLQDGLLVPLRINFYVKSNQISNSVFHPPTSIYI
jgi:hypothetical protein